MLSDVEKLLYQRFVLHSHKLELVEELNLNSYAKSLHTLNRIHFIITREIFVTRRLIKTLQATTYTEDIRQDFVLLICAQLEKIQTMLVQEHSTLCQTNVLTYSFSALQKVLTGKQGYFHRRVRVFKKLVNKELVLYRLFFALSEKLPKAYQVPEGQVQKSWKLVLELQREVHVLAKAIGDTSLVRTQGEHILALIAQIQKSEIYEFVQQDVDYIKTKVTYVMKHPKENKLAYFLTTVYIIAPGTFELTGAILFFRYFGKYSLIQAKKFKVFRRASAP
ncbi:hypothetical protein HZA98_04810 [Candidatus Woesearchaeota archaeon]|nr:hypothetical protein [Candidatus Woesearchaeota archaeon]